MKINNINVAFTANKITKAEAKLINDTLLNSKNVDIICHDSTDKDAGNSALLMWEYLKQKGISSRIILSQDIESLKLRNTNCNIVQASDIDEKSDADTVLCVDFSSYGRMHENTIGLLDNEKKVVCLDHHTKPDLFKDDFIEINTSLNDDELPENTSLHYIDTSAKSATSVIYRFFEAINEDIDENRAYDILCGLLSDGGKKGLIECDGEKKEIKLKDEFIQNKNAYEIFCDVLSKIKPSDREKIIKHIDIMSNLTDEEKEFYNNLFDRLAFSKDGKIAYVEISPDDKEWQKMGGDTPRTSSILNRFRQNILKDESYKDVHSVIVFYKAKNAYRLSIHSKKDDLVGFYNLAYEKLEDKYNMFSIGGHKSRGGGKVVSDDLSVCHRFAKDVIKCLDEYDCSI